LLKSRLHAVALGILLYALAAVVCIARYLVLLHCQFLFSFVCCSSGNWRHLLTLLQVAALEDLLGFLSGVGPFKGLSRELLTSLAVYVRPVRVGQGELLAVAGDKTNALIIIQVSWLPYQCGF
jgi:CRP-like cAMP-binding protein